MYRDSLTLSTYQSSSASGTVPSTVEIVVAGEVGGDVLIKIYSVGSSVVTFLFLAGCLSLLPDCFLEGVSAGLTWFKVSVVDVSQIFSFLFLCTTDLLFLLSPHLIVHCVVGVAEVCDGEITGSCSSLS